MKKIFIISAVLLIVVLIFLGIYNFAFKEVAPVVQQPVVQPDTESMPVKLEKITNISDNAVIGAVVDKKTQDLKYYDASTGIVWKTNSNGKEKQQVTNTKISGLKQVSWSFDQSKVLTTIQKDGQNSFYMYDYSLQKGTLLKNGLDTVIWDNIGAKIIYKYFDAVSKERTINIANPDGSGWQKIVNTNIRDIVIAPIPLASFISFWNKPNANEETQLQTVGLTGGEAKMLLNGKYGADYLWSPDGSRALVSSLPNKDAKTVTLGIIMVDGRYQDLNIPTFVSKCIWSQDNTTLFYALPGEIPTDAVMPNDYQENKFNTRDTFWKVNIATGEKTRVVETADIKEKYDASDIFLSATEDALYFVNKIDQKLYRLAL